MKLDARELRQRALEAAEQYRSCVLCAHRCGVDRTKGPAGRCREGSSVFLAGAGLHFGEEQPLVGAAAGPGRRRGSGLVLIATNDEREGRLAGERIELRGRGLGHPA